MRMNSIITKTVTIAAISLAACGGEMDEGLDTDEQAIEARVQDRTLVCLPTGKEGHSIEIEVKSDAVPALLSRGAFVGPCLSAQAMAVEAAAVSKKTLICHFTKKYPEGQDTEVPEKTVSRHLSHGDYVGPCITP